ncbi:MAG: DUF835 domain-containing protein [Thermoplasmata archaeon]|uniref:DUF835 domain-containing protein n=1 Tax=Candidatus Sysuiplasma superficiale TaxID=2823368 RepID=A0A8J7YRM1_9ARCH|nr:DUF835 domain-containing protein [Candidatus Sysuiplasma superficiale]MBX8643936.1 DUF835 domain-containing protein [Candidatus Sysuiplasma superficiale]MCL4346332.1 DUF835 domain-containing protein [Candidatus Thermoplasmatota archaeon]
MKATQLLWILILSFMLIFSGASLIQNVGMQPALVKASPSGTVQLDNSRNQAVLYLTSSNSSFYSHTWNISNSPVTAKPYSQTSIYLNSIQAESGFVPFVPGYADSATPPKSSLPEPNKTTANGWLTPFPLNTSVPAGRWNIDVSLNETEGTGLTGSIYFGAALFNWNQSTSAFVLLSVQQNRSLNLISNSGNINVNVSVNGSYSHFTSQDHLFVEFFLNVTSFTSSASYTIGINMGGINDSFYTVRYPYFGWLNGTVTPVDSHITIDRTNLSQSFQGAFNVTLAPSGYWVNASMLGYQNFTSEITVRSGVASIMHIVLKKLYAARIEERGLPSGTSWAVSVNGTLRSQMVNYTIMALTNGSYKLSVESVPGFTVTSAPSEFSISGGNVTVEVDFSLTVYRVSFHETGLKQGTRWNVTIGSSNYTTAGSEINASLPNGTYSYRIGIPHGYTTTNSTGNFAVNGSNGTISINFTVQEYRVLFIESGLPASTKWSVTVNGVTKTENSSVIVFYEPAGTYDYAISPISGFSLSNSSGSFTVLSGNVNITISFTHVTKAGSQSLFSEPLNLFYFAVLLIILVQIEILASFLYFRRNRDSAKRPDRGVRQKRGNAAEKPLSQIMEENASGIALSSPSVANGGGAVNSKESDDVLKPEASAAPKKEVPLESMLEYGTSFAFFEEKAERSISLFEVGLKRGLKGLCFTREFPDKLAQRHDLKGAVVMWLSNIGSQNSIRPKDLEKITLQCNEFLAASQSIILIDGLEYLITNNGFISVLKMLQFLRDSTAVNNSVLIISINQHAIKDSEVSLIKREIDRIIE